MENPIKLAARLGRAGAKWAAAGFPQRSEEEIYDCLAICKTCRHFNGRCKLCGCITKLKARMATEDCPVEKWPTLPTQADQLHLDSE